MNVTPSLNPVQLEPFAQSLPLSEGAVYTIASLANGLLQILYPVGSMMYSMLTPAQLLIATNNATSPRIWALADGSDVSGSAYATLIGNTLPDLRGLFIRGKNGPASTTNPDGNLALGTYTADKFASHTHVFGAQIQQIAEVNPGGGAGRDSLIYPNTPPNTFTTTSGIVGNETAPTCVTVSIYIRIN